MEPYEYIFIQPGEESYEPGWLRFVPDKMRARIRELYIWKKAPFTETQIEEMGLPGMRIILPLSRQELREYEEEKVQKLLRGIISRINVQNIVVDPVLRPYMRDIPHLEGESVARLFLHEMIEDARRKHQIAKKELALIILDEKHCDDILAVLERRREELNFLTIITADEAAYQPMCERLFAETGLLVQMLHPEAAWNMGRMHGNLIVDFRTERDKLYRLFPEHAVVLELSGNRQKVRDLLVKRKDLAVYNRAQVLYEEKEVHPGVVSLLVSDREKSAEFSRNICINCCLTPDWR